MRPPFAIMSRASIEKRLEEKSKNTPTTEGIWIEEDLYYAAVFNLNLDQFVVDGIQYFTLNGRNYYHGE